MSLSHIDDLTHAVASVAHVEKLYQEGQLDIRKLKVLRQPAEQASMEAKAKLKMWQTERDGLDRWTFQWFLFWCICQVEQEKKRCDKGIEKAQGLVDEAQIKVDEADDKIRQVENQTDKYAVDHRALTKCREELSELLDSLIGSGSTDANERTAREQVEAARARLTQATQDAEKLAKVSELLERADRSIIEAIVELRESNDKKTVGQGEVYFPEGAYKAIVEARELYPTLPGMPQPVIYDKTADETGAFYSPMQKYLWDVRNGLSDIRKWCGAEALALMDKEHEATVELGTKTDAWNMERRRLAAEQS